jgi:hypothetical protein
MPYRAVTGLAIAADPRGREHAPGFVLVWWLSYVASMLLGALVTTTMTTSRGDVLTIRSGNPLEIASNTLATVGLISLWATLRFVDNGQAHWARKAIATEARLEAKGRRRKKRAVKDARRPED